MVKIIIYLKALKRLIKYRSLKKAIFFIYEQDMDVSKYDNDMLMAQLGYFGHHTEKVLKHNNRGNRGKNKRDKLELLLREFQKRDIKEPKVVEWAKDLIEYYDNNKDIYIKNIDKAEAYPQAKEILDFIKQRTTTRFWQPKDIDDHIIKDILEVAMSSALSCNRQTIRFSVVNNRVENMIVGDSNNKSMLDKAPIVIYVAEDERFFNDLFETALDVGGVCATMITAAHFYGIEGTWIYQDDYYCNTKLRDKLGFSKNHKIYSVVTLGYPMDQQLKPPRFGFVYANKKQ